MRKNSLFIASSLLLLGLVACGGSGTATSSSAGVTPATLPPAPTPTPAPTGPAYPSAAGDTFAFAGMMTRSDTYTYPAPSPLPPTSATDTIAQNIKVLATSNPFGTGTVQDFNVNETDTYPAQTLSSTSDFYYQAGASALTLLGYSTKDDAGNTGTMVFTTPQTIDQLPETGGASWTNSPAGSFTQTYIDGSSSVDTIAADGSYTDTEQLYGTGTNYPSIQAVVTENADGSGLFQIVYYENGRSGYFPNEVIDENYIVGAASAQSANAQFVTVNYQQVKTYAGAATPAPPTVFATMPVWYATPISLYSESDKDLGSQAIPASCNAPTSFGAKAMELQQSVAQTDSVLGTITTTTTTSYVVNGFGPVCVVLAGTVNTYFDYSRDTTTGPIYYQGSNPMQTTTIAQTLTLKAQAALPQSGGRKASAQGIARSPISAAEIGIARLRLAGVLQRDRVMRIKALGKTLILLSKTKGLK